MKNQKLMGATLTGVMSLSAVAGVAGAINEVQSVEAAANQAVKNVHDKIEHINYSLKNNYLGLKNVGQWEAYIKEARVLNAKLPNGSSKDKYGERIDRAEALVNAAGRVNKVEQSMEVNSAIMKNVPQWEKYVQFAKADLEKVDLRVFKKQHSELIERVAVRTQAIDKIKTDYNKRLKAVEAMVIQAEELAKTDKVAALAKANQAKEVALKLQSHPSKDELIKRIDTLIGSLQDGGSVEKNLVIKTPSDANGISGAYNNITIEIPEKELVSLKNVQVKNLTVNSGANLDLVGTTVENMVVNDKDDSMNVSIDNSSSIKNGTLNSGATISSKSRTVRSGLAIGNLKVNTNDIVILKVAVGDVAVENSVTLIVSGDINKINISGKDAVVQLKPGVTVDNISVEAGATGVVVLGDGTINSADVKAPGTVVDVTNKPGNIENTVTDRNEIDVKVGLKSVIDMQLPGGISDVPKYIEAMLKRYVPATVTVKVEVVAGSNDTYKVTMTSGTYSESKNMKVVVYEGDSYVMKEAEMVNGKVSFVWGSQGGIGSKNKLESTSGSNYDYFSDGAYLTLQVLDGSGKVVKMSDVFDKITLQTQEDGRVDTIPDSNREKADFGFEGFDSYKTILAQAEGKNSVFYGVRQSKGVAHTVGFNLMEMRQVNLTVSPKAGIASGEYTVRINAAQQGEAGTFKKFGEPIEYKFSVDKVTASVETGDLSLAQRENSIDKLTSKIKLDAKYENLTKAKIIGVTYTSDNSSIVEGKANSLELIARNPGTTSIKINSIMVDKDGNLATTNDVERVNIEGNNVINLDCRDMAIGNK
ncbi:MAG: hypothetical protein RR840_04785 [Clostridium sp.]